MSLRLHCDGCGRDVAEDAAVNWYGITLVGADGLTFGQRTLIGATFCSEQCIHDCIAERLKLRAAGQ